MYFTQLIVRMSIMQYETLPFGVKTGSKYWWEIPDF